MSNPYAPPSINEPGTGNTFLRRIAGFTFITLGLMISVIGLTLIGRLPIVLGLLFALLIFSAGIAMVALSLRTQNRIRKDAEKIVVLADSRVGNSDYWRSTRGPHSASDHSSTAIAAGSDVSKTTGTKGF